jgi:heparan sulfate N-deacetylase/N-sulfotransferase NDST2
MIIDGDKLKNDPVAVMDRVQTFLGLEVYFDYSRKLK